MIEEIRDFIIIIGVTISLLMLLISTILILIIFLKVRRLVNYIENSIEDISSIRKKIKDTIPKPISSILDGAITVKTVIDKLFIKKKEENQK